MTRTAPRREPGLLSLALRLIGLVVQFGYLAYGICKLGKGRA